MKALVLAGGGAKGAFQVGMLQGLVDVLGHDFHVIRGVSVGALNAAFLAGAPASGNSHAALAQRVDDLETLWRHEIKGNHSVYAERSGFVGMAAGADSLYSIEPLRRLIERHIKIDELRHSGRDFSVGVVSLVTGLYSDIAPGDPRFMDKLIASASIPVVFPFVDVEAEKDALVDGGARNITPLSSAFKARPEEIYVLLTSKVVLKDGEWPESAVIEHDYAQWDDNWLGTAVNGLDVLKRTLDILTDEIYLDDIRNAIKWNQILYAAEAMVQATASGSNLAPPSVNALDYFEQTLATLNRRAVPIHVLAPQMLYGTDNSAIDFDPAHIAEAIDHGRTIGSDPAEWVFSMQLA